MLGASALSSLTLIPYTVLFPFVLTFFLGIRDGTFFSSSPSPIPLHRSSFFEIASTSSSGHYLFLSIDTL